MTKYYMLMAADGMRGVDYYTAETEAQAAADRRNALMGRKWWDVREVWLMR